MLDDSLVSCIRQVLRHTCSRAQCSKHKSNSYETDHKMEWWKQLGRRFSLWISMSLCLLGKLSAFPLRSLRLGGALRVISCWFVDRLFSRLKNNDPRITRNNTKRTVDSQRKKTRHEIGASPNAQPRDSAFHPSYKNRILLAACQDLKHCKSSSPVHMPHQFRESNVS